MCLLEHTVRQLGANCAEVRRVLVLLAISDKRALLLDIVLQLEKVESKKVVRER